MGINSHVLPGDLVTTHDKATLYDVHPEEEMGWPHRVTQLVDGNILCLVITVAAAGSNRGGHAFFIMSSTGKLGWLWNHAVMPVCTAREAYL